MDIRVLEYFVVVSDELNITRAAEKLHLTQPTLSRQMKSLEETLGVDLFKRTNHNVELTDAGILLRRRAMDIITIYRKIEDQFSSTVNYTTGIIRIGMMESKALSIVSQWIVDFQKDYPLIKFDVISGQPYVLANMLASGELDIALISKEVVPNAYQMIDTHIDDEWGILAHESLFKDKMTITAREILETGKLIFIPQSEVTPHPLLSEWYGEIASLSDYSAKYDILPTIISTVRYQEGIVFCLEPAESYAHMHFLKMDPPNTTKPVLAWKDSKDPYDLVHIFTSYVKDSQNE